MGAETRSKANAFEPKATLSVIPTILNSLYFVIPSEATDLQFAAKCRSLTPFGMTIQKGALCTMIC
jgi:hypothetical protein